MKGTPGSANNGQESEFLVLIDEVYTPNQRHVEPQRSMDGWIVFVSNLHVEITEDELRDHFGDCGTIDTVILPLERQTGFVKGYSLVQYLERNAAQNAVETLHMTKLMDQAISVTWCFAKR